MTDDTINRIFDVAAAVMIYYVVAWYLVNYFVPALKSRQKWLAERERERQEQRQTRVISTQHSVAWWDEQIGAYRLRPIDPVQREHLLKGTWTPTADTADRLSPNDEEC